MMDQSLEIYIEADIEEVFPYLIEDEKLRLWNSFVIENIYESEEERKLPVPGTRYTSVQRIDQKVRHFPAEYVEYDPPYLITVTTTSKEGLSTTRYSLSRSGSGTLVRILASAAPSNWYYTIIGKLMGGLTKRLVLKPQFNQLKRVVEQYQHPAMKRDHLN
ncbi:SRPBCC domain-containing protein [Paenibacillus sp. JCM 10914]|uniref:SRPBCC family protein n=1 Tax=Paenibacillus sp. JCM 10914 TaxID=1236974 RepID=UPI0003CC5E8A|nr:SRPBCC domain-containing protein [Paenibacillus sp. JCM 10914]GAE08608.1 hypothetical protein JCM10914_4913 [Paenibacillus sp. JCM 10914]